MGKHEKPGRKRRATAPVYTRGGDAGETYSPALGRVRKDTPRVAANGAVDELNCAIGEIIARVEHSALTRSRTAAILRRLKRRQRELLVAGAIISGAVASTARTRAAQRANVRRLEREIDQMAIDLPPLKGFILPGGDLAASGAHLARAVCRRAERDCVAASDDESFPREVLPHLNRLADWLFVLARWLARAAGGEDESWRRPTRRKKAENGR